MIKVFIPIQYPDIKENKEQTENKYGIMVLFFFKNVICSKTLYLEIFTRSRKTNNSTGQQHKCVMRTLTMDALDAC